MIKCILSGKSLKQFFIISLISCFILLGNSFVNAGFVRQIGISGYSPYDNSVDISVLNKGSFLSTSLGIGLNAFYLAENYYFAWIYNNDLGTSSIYNHTNGNQGFLKHFAVCDELTGDLINWSLTSSFHCVSYDYNSYNTGLISNLLSSVNSNDYFGFDFMYSSNTYRSTLCISNHFLGKSVCFDNCYVSNPNNYSCVMYGINSMNGLNVGDTTGSLNLGGQFGQIDRFLLTSSPAVSISNVNTGNNEISIGGGLEGYDYTKIDTGDLVYYFENNPYYRYDEGVCYIGTDNFDTLYSSGSTLGLFRANSGGTIFDLFSDKFGNSFSLNNVGAFINAWNINYFTWFKGGNRDENNIPLFNAYYSLSSGFYQDFSDNLIVPFIGNPIAYYFMGYVSSLYGEDATQGQSIATYCYYKLGLDKNSGGLDVVDDTSKDYLKNASDYINQRNKFYGLYSGGINIQSQSWSGSVLDYFTGGQDNYDFNSFFSSSFNKFKNVISLNLSDLGAGVLPTYIILFLMAIILFRFLSH